MISKVHIRALHRKVDRKDGKPLGNRKNGILLINEPINTLLSSMVTTDLQITFRLIKEFLAKKVDDAFDGNGKHVLS